MKWYEDTNWIMPPRPLYYCCNQSVDDAFNWLIEYKQPTVDATKRAVQAIRKRFETDCNRELKTFPLYWERWLEVALFRFRTRYTAYVKERFELNDLYTELRTGIDEYMLECPDESILSEFYPDEYAHLTSQNND